MNENEKCQSLLEMMADTLRGPTAWLVVLVWIYGFAFTALAVVSAVWFFQVETTRGMILWATLFLASWMGLLAIKMWVWGLMFRNAIIRQIHRLGCQINQACQGGRSEQ